MTSLVLLSFETIALICLSLPHFAHSIVSQSFVYETLEEKVSDLSASSLPTYDGSLLEKDTIILAGGCIETAWSSERRHFCKKLTKKTWAFYSEFPNPILKTIKELAEAPRERHRHAAAVVNGKVYVAGGRDAMDNLIKEIDVYDPTKDEWSTFYTLPDDLVTSDNAMIGYDGKIYIMGGYNVDYSVTFDRLFSIDVETKAVNKDLAPVQKARGDAQAVLFEDDSGTAIYYMGGNTGNNGFCNPMNEVEKYDFKTDTWSFIESLVTPRADTAAAVMNGRIYSIGGGQTHEKYCSINTSHDKKMSYNELPAALRDVESYNLNGDNSKWQVETDLNNSRFRLAAAFLEGGIYIFGGQGQYYGDCDCFPLQDSIYLFCNEAETCSGSVSLSTKVLFSIASIISLYLIVG